MVVVLICYILIQRIFSKILLIAPFQPHIYRTLQKPQFKYKETVSLFDKRSILGCKIRYYKRL